MKITYNQLSLFLGIAMIVTNSLITYLFQMKMFGKYRNRVKNAVNKKSG